MAAAAQSLSILLLVAAVALAGFTAVALRYVDEPGARGFAIAGASMACWTVVLSINIYPMQFLAVHVSMTLRNAFVIGMSLGWLLFVLEYLERDRISLKPLPVAVVLLIPVLTVLLTATNPLHHLVIGPDTPSAVGGGPDIDWGPWHLVFMAFGFTANIVPAGLLARDLRGAHGPHRRQVQLLLLGWAIAFVGANDYLLTGAIEGVPSYVRLSPFAFVLSAGFFAVALFRHQLFGLVPVSRRTVVETMPDPVVAVDDDGRVLDMNPAAEAVFGASADRHAAGAGEDAPAATGTASAAVGHSETGIIGAPLSDVCGDYPDLLECFERGGADVEVEIDVKGTSRHFSVTCEAVGDEGAGSVVLFRDVTALKRREAELERTNEQLDQFASFVTHDLRNPLTVANLSLETAESLDDEHVDRVRDAHDRMEAMISSVRELTRIDPEAVQTTALEVETVARRAWDGVQTDGATLAVLDSGAVLADEQYLLHVFENLYRNSVEHAGPDVAVTVGSLPDGFFVEDDGPGIPPGEREAVLERGFSSSSEGGFGLAIVRNVAAVHGWEVAVTEGSEGGARFEFTAVERVESGAE